MYGMALFVENARPIPAMPIAALISLRINTINANF